MRTTVTERFTNNFSQLRKNMVSGSFNAGINIILLLVSYPIFLNYLGLELYGVWALVSITSMIGQFGTMGINDAVVKFTAEYLGKRQDEEVRKIVGTALRVLTAISGACITVAFLWTAPIAKLLGVHSNYKDIAVPLIRAIAVLIPLMLFADAMKGILMGAGRTDLANFLLMGGRISQVVFTIVFLAAGAGIWSMYAGLVSLYLLTLFMFIYFIRRELGYIPLSFKGGARKEMRRVLRFGGSVSFMRFLSLLILPFNKIIISRYIGLEPVTFFDIAVRSAQQIRGVFENGLKAIMPEVSAIKGRAEELKAGVMSVLKHGMFYVLMTGTPIFLILIFSARFILNLWLGVNCSDETVFGFRILTGVYLLNLAASPVFYVYLGLHRIFICIVSVVLNALVNFAVLESLVFLKWPFDLYTVFLVHASGIAILSIFLFLTFRFTEIEPEEHIDEEELPDTDGTASYTLADAED